MRTLLMAVSALALSGSFALAQTPPPPPPPDQAGPTAEEPGGPPPPPGEEMDAGGMDDHAPGGPREHMRGPGPRHGMRGPGGGPRGGPHGRGMGSEFKVEIGEDGGVKVEVRCGAREEARGCADITMELLDRALGN